MKIATEEMAVTLFVVDKVRRGPAIIEFTESPIDSGGRLIIVCGLPGSGKTTHAKQLEVRLPAVRFCPDEWMDALSLDLWDEARRQKIESLQWEFAQLLLAHRETVIIEWGTWARSERATPCGCGRASLGLLSSCTISPLRLMSFSTGSNAGVWRIHRSHESSSSSGRAYSKHRQETKRRYSITPWR